jgi:signal transduction histidine kinase
MRTREDWIGELKHEINSPLAAIRNALYLAAVRAGDPEVERYLKLADEEVSRIARVLNLAGQIYENTRTYIRWPGAEAAESAA